LLLLLLLLLLNRPSPNPSQSDFQFYSGDPVPDKAEVDSTGWKSN